VLAAVTAHAQPVQGFNSVALGRFTYRAVANRNSYGATSRRVNATALSNAPGLKFNNKDRMQAQWARRCAVGR